MRFCFLILLFVSGFGPFISDEAAFPNFFLEGIPRRSAPLIATTATVTVNAGFDNQIFAIVSK